MPFENRALTEYRAFLKGKTASVIGVGISNIPLIDFLLDCGAHVTARDKRTREMLAENPALDVGRLEEKGVTFICGEGYLGNIADSLIYKSPGVRFDKPEILVAKKAGALITSEMEAFLSLCPATVIAVTGSNGKTTTTTLVSELLKNAGKRVFVGGNIGTPLLSRVGDMTPDDFAVLELSSFQLHTVNRFENAGLPFAHITFPDVGVITNVSPNHLDWHTDMDEYAFSKRAVFTHMKSTGRVVLNRRSDDYSALFAKEAQKEGKTVSLFSVCDGFSACGASLDGDTLYLDGEPWLSRGDILLPGDHNIENYMAALLAVKPYITKEAAYRTATTFGGVPHRLEIVAKKDGVTYYNSSIDSSPSRTAAALSCFGKEDGGRIRLILGGYDKKIPFEPLAEPVCARGCVCYITGDTADKIERALRSYEAFNENDVPLVRCASFDEAVTRAVTEARPGDKVLLSPACASFDAFRNFEQRGERFRTLVKRLIGADTTGNAGNKEG